MKKNYFAVTLLMFVIALGAMFSLNSCVKNDSDYVEGEYIDEYGINHGHGTKIGKTIWAPVNCGYHKTDYPYGKLYQWGRKYGQGYSGELLVDGVKKGMISDAKYPKNEDLRPAPVSISEGNKISNKDLFYTKFENYNDWCSPQSDNWLPENNPCPKGWRVPTISEAEELEGTKNTWKTVDTPDNVSGNWYGENSEIATVSNPSDCVFLPAAGFRTCDAEAIFRGGMTFYWTLESIPSPYEPGSIALSLDFHDGAINIYHAYKASGYAVRCVKLRR